jgi:hypothetical protein
MNVVQFPECNVVFGPPPDMEESQVRRIPAFQGKAEGGGCDGADIVVVAYQLTPQELLALAQQQGVIYLSMIGGLAPHYLSFNFQQATHPA